jgi:hypothetical protein
LKYYKELRNIQRNGYTHYFYEGTVGAGLPIISTVRNLLDSGDRVSKIEGIFSGTLSYIFNTFGTDDKPFSDVVKTAKELGYTEPDPRDDLSGMDVARKVVILARECGLDLELSDVPIESLVPEPLRDAASADDFMARLPEFDGEMTTRRRAARSSVTWAWWTSRTAPARWSCARTTRRTRSAACPARITSSRSRRSGTSRGRRSSSAVRAPAPRSPPAASSATSSGSASTWARPREREKRGFLLSRDRAAR